MCESEASRAHVLERGAHKPPTTLLDRHLVLPESSRSAKAVRGRRCDNDDRNEQVPSLASCPLWRRHTSLFPSDADGRVSLTGSKGEFGHDSRRRGGEEGAGFARAGHGEEIHRDGMFVQSPKYFTRMTWTRILMFPFSLLVFGLTAVTWIGYNEQTDAASWVEKLVFNAELLFMLLSYFQVMLLDPGGIPKRWHSKIAASPGLRDRFRLCRKTNVYKPPRANFDHITNSQVLNFDHFCPW